MDIKATVFFDASPALQQLVENLIRVATGSAFFAAQPLNNDVGTPVSIPSQANLPQESVQPSLAVSTTEKPTLEQVRILTARKVKVNKSGVRKALAECGAQSIPLLAEDRYADYLAKLAAL